MPKLFDFMEFFDFMESQNPKVEGTSKTIKFQPPTTVRDTAHVTYAL